MLVFREFLRTKAAVISVYHLMWCEYFTLTQGYPVTRLTVLHNCSFYVVVSSFETACETMAAVYFSLRLCFFGTLLFTIAGKYWIVLSGTWLTGKWAILISGTRSRRVNTALNLQLSDAGPVSFAYKSSKPRSVNWRLAGRVMPLFGRGGEGTPDS